MGLYTFLFYKPVFNLLIGIYTIIPGSDIGLAIIALTVLIKLILWPISEKALRSQRALSELQPKVSELKKKYSEKDQQEQLAREMMALYSKEKVSPFSSCLPLLIQLPVFIALYQSLSHGLQSSGFEQLYSFIPVPETIDPHLFGIVDLSVPNLVLAFLAGASQFFQARMMVHAQQPKHVPGAKDEQMLASMNKQMMYIMPVITLLIGARLPGGLALYWLVMNLLTILQQHVSLRRARPGSTNNDPIEAEIVSSSN